MSTFRLDDKPVSEDEVTLRDYFAAHAPAYPFPVSTIPDEDGYPVEVFVRRDAAWRYMHADAMLAEREKVRP